MQSQSHALMGYECIQVELERRAEESSASWEVPWQSRPVAAYVEDDSRL